MLPEDQKRILGYFIEEAKDHLNTIEQGLLNLQATIEDSEMANEVFRAAHSVKGGAAMLGLESIQHTSHRLEDYFKILKESPIRVDRTLESMLLQLFDSLQEQLEQLQGPFGLTDDKAKEIMAGIEPVFDQVNEHLESLVRSAATASVAKQPAEKVAASAAIASSSQVTSASHSETSALQLVFKSDVPAHLRTMLGLFKQADNAATRQALQDICQQLHQIGEQFDLSNWCELIDTARRIVSNDQQTFRTLAPLLIKDIKAGQDLVIAGQANRITVSAAMQELLPPEPVVSLLEEESLDALLEEALNEDSEADLTDLFATAEAEQATANLALEDTNGWFKEVAQTNIADTTGADLPSVFEDLATNSVNSLVDIEQPVPVLGTGPEVGTAELNSLADLFEGEVSELDDVWEEEEVPEIALEEAQEDPLEASPNEEFADLFLADHIDEPLAVSETDDFTSLFGNAFLEEPQSEGLADLPSLSVAEIAPSPAIANAFSDTVSADDDFDALFGSASDEKASALSNGDELGGMDSFLDLAPAPLKSSSGFDFDGDLDSIFENVDFENLDTDNEHQAPESSSNDGTESQGLTEPFEVSLSHGNETASSGLDAGNLVDSLWDEEATKAPNTVLDFDDFAFSEEPNDPSPTHSESPFDFGDLDFTGAETAQSSDDVESQILEDLDLGSPEEDGELDGALDFDLDMSFADGDEALVDQAPSALFEPDSDSAAHSTDSTLGLNEFSDLDFDFDLVTDAEGASAQERVHEGAALESNISSALEVDLELPDPFALDLEELDSLSEAVTANLPEDYDELPASDEDPSSPTQSTTASNDDLDGDLWSMAGDELEPSQTSNSLPDLDAVDDFFGSVGSTPLAESGDDFFDVPNPTAIAVTNPVFDDFLTEDLTNLGSAEAALPDLLSEGDTAIADTLLSADVFGEAPVGEAASADSTLPSELAESIQNAVIPDEDLAFLDNSELNFGLPGSAPELAVETPDVAVSSHEAEADADFDGLNSLLEDDAFPDVTAVGDTTEADADFNQLDSLLDDDVLPDPPVGNATEADADFDGLDSLLEDDAFPDVTAVGDAAETDPDFDELDSLLSEDAPPAEPKAVVGPEPSAAEIDDFSDLEALLEAEATGNTNASISSSNGASKTTNNYLGSGDDEFEDLEKLLEEADQLGGSAPAIGLRRGQAAARRSPRRPNTMADQNMRVSVKHLDNLSNLVGELVVNRNSLEQDQERLRQFLDNLLFQVQQLNDVGQRLRDLYERSLLESSLISSRQAFQSAGVSHGSGGNSHATGVTFDALEMDRFTGFHTLSQEMIELIVRVRESSSDIAFTIESTDQITRQFRQVTTQLQEGLNKARMVPFAQTVDRLPRAVRDISLKCGKEAKLIMEGRDTLIDKMILERLFDPMTHLVNNAITHGVETPEERAASGKSREGTITVRAFYQGNQTVIYIADDGAGINAEVVKQKALKKGLITPGEARSMSKLDVYELLFLPGFSTRDQADDFAGRGVGMDVVRTALSEIRGSITIDSEMGRGTSFTIRLPLTLSISKALSCVNNQARIAFPMDGVEDMFDAPRERVQVNDQGQTCILWRDTLLPFRPLSDLLQFNRTIGRGRVYGGHQDDDIISIVVLRSANTFIALQVDQVIGEQEIVIKQLEGPVPKPTGIAGATVLGDGRVMPIADVLELIDLSMGRVRRDSSASLWSQTDDEGPVIEETPIQTDPTVLIVDDSITVRELLSMSFNKVGYRVEQARDGQEAWEKMRSGLPCDLVFCDIEMPRMDGLELLSRMQKDSALSQIPIAMLTSRGADRHRQMAVDLGARGYFTKPYLEEMLLDAAQRMLNGENLVNPGKS